jgi:transcription initiation factor IIF auxiliary subunit
LDEITSVEYTLHPSFANPVRSVTDRSSKFRLKTAGWGTFTVYPKAIHQDGSQTLLEHELELLYPDGRATMA